MIFRLLVSLILWGGFASIYAQKIMISHGAVDLSISSMAVP